MSFQWIFDNAANISMVRRPIVSQTVARDQRIRAISRGGNIWRFTVTMPNGLRWQDNRANIEAIDYANILTPDTVNMSKTAYNFIMGYRGNADTSAIRIQPNGDSAQFTLTTPGGTSSQYAFRAGDFVQPIKGSPNTGRVYTVLQDVMAVTGAQVPVNRTILEYHSDGPMNVNVGSQVTWKVICTQCPTWTITPGGLVTWSGPFQFAESLL